MKLYLNGQDIKKLVIANIADDKTLFVHEGETETFLAAIVRFLKGQGSSIKELEEVYVVVGPGSATALRATLTIMNVLAFAQTITLFGFTKEPSEQDIDSLRTIMENKMKFSQQGKRLEPEYGQEAKITTSTRDALKRKLN